MRTAMTVCAVLVTAASASGAGADDARVSLLAERTAGVVSVLEFGAKGDGRTDDTRAVIAARDAALAAHSVLYFPPGRFLVAPGALKFGARPGVIIRGAGQLASVIKATKPGHVLEISGGWTHTIEIADLGIEGAGRDTRPVSHCIYIHDNGPYGGPSHMTLRDLRVSQCSGRGVFVPEEWHSRFENITVTQCGDNLFDLQGGNTTLLVRCYAQDVMPGKAGFRIRGGNVTMISCNGIDASADADWGVFGGTASDDGRATYFHGTLIGCNLEDFTNRGLYLKVGSTVTIINSTFIAPKTGSVTAIQYDWASEGGGPFVGVSFATKGASWRNGEPVHVSRGRAAPFFYAGFFDDGSNPGSFWNDATGERMSMTRLAVRPGRAAGLTGAEPPQSAGAASSVFRTGEAEWGPFRVAESGRASLPVRVPGASLGDPIQVGYSAPLPSGALLVGNIVADEQVTVTLLNLTGAPVEVPHGTLRVVATRR